MQYKHFIIMDYGASQTHTHHFKSIETFAKIIVSQKHKVTILLPKASRLDFFIPLVTSHKVLFALSHINSFSFFHLDTWINSIFSKFFHIFRNENRLSKLLRSLIVVFIVNSAVRAIQKNRSEELNLLFPTFDPISIALCHRLEKMNIKCNIYARLTHTAEKRGIISKDFPLDQFLVKSQSFINVKLKYGFETKAYARFLGVNEPNLSPFPYCKKILEESSDPNITVSFLGVAKSIKGSPLALKIIENVSLEMSNINWLVQHGDPSDPQLKNISKYNVEIFFGKLTNVELDSLLSRSNILCLPYEKTKYLLNASAMAYEAADYFLPVITFHGTAFCEDILDYKIGIVCDTLEAMVRYICDLSQSQIHELRMNIDKYNNFRIQANLDFLEI